MTTVSLATLNAAGKAEFVTALGDIYEQAPWVAEAVHGQRPFASLNALHEAMTAAIRDASAEQRIALLKGHPDLAGKAARAGTMTADSKAEQASAGLDRLSEGEYAALHRLNDAYRKKFGIPFIICVRRHGKDSILRQFERRLQNGAAAETKAALTEVFRIGALRLDQRVEATDKLKVHGRLSTHVLDTHAGHPAAGVAVELMELSAHGEPRMIASATTNLDGRSDQPLIGGRPIPTGRYELRLHIGDYFSKRGAPHADPPFLDVVPVRFGVAEPEGHYHVPLLVTPWSYSTYRGS
jgi:2-oxo-4-hydroxy-4-carboxy-5-ureidoimidazoline decarboxylase